jgi:hypothetical protein
MNKKNPLFNNYKLLFTAITSFVFGLLLIWLGYRIGEADNVYPVTYIICLAGCIAGWIVGILTTPYDKTDEDKLGRFTKLIGTFLSGYVLGKIDRIIEVFINPQAILNFNPIIGLRMLLFVCFFGLVWIVVFVFRQYAVEDDK